MMRKQNEIKIEVAVSCWEAQLTGDTKGPTLDGSVTIVISPDAQQIGRIRFIHYMRTRRGSYRFRCQLYSYTASRTRHLVKIIAQAQWIKRKGGNEFEIRLVGPIEGLAIDWAVVKAIVPDLGRTRTAVYTAAKPTRDGNTTARSRVRIAIDTSDTFK